MLQTLTLCHKLLILTPIYRSHIHLHLTHPHNTFFQLCKHKLPTQIILLPLQHPSQIIIPFLSLSLHLLLPHSYPLTTLIIINPRPYDARPKINTLLPIFKIIIVFSLQRLLLPRPTFGILSTQFYLILVFLHLIVISLCPFLLLPNPLPMLKLLVMIVGLKQCQPSYMLSK